MTFRFFLGNITTERDGYYDEVKVICRSPLNAGLAAGRLIEARPQ